MRQASIGQRRAQVPPLLFASALFLVPAQALAQYKNTSFGLDAGWWLITKPTLPDGPSLDEIPIRLSNGLRVGGETNFKMDQDHWWFTARVNVAFLQFGGSEKFDKEADKALGTLMGVQGMMGLRYIILTDYFRPYLQASLSWMHLFSFANAASDKCTNTGLPFCSGDQSNEDIYLPHANVGGVHAQPGVELIMTRDVALHLFVDYAHWIVINAADNDSVVLGLGILFFT